MTCLMSMSLTSSGPTFVGIGGQKCASTWLAECLAAHPEVFVHPKKEIKYWNRLTQEGRPNADTDRPVDWYRDHFDAPEACRGEFTPDYLFDPVGRRFLRQASSRSGYVARSSCDRRAASTSASSAPSSTALAFV